MVVTTTKAPSKAKIAKAALFAAFTIAATSNAMTLEANAQTITKPSVVVEEASIKEVPKERYIESTFGETLDTKYCVSEKAMEAVTEKVCAEGDFKYVTPEILESVAYQESRFVTSAENGTAITMYQIKPQFHEESMNEAGLTLEELENDPEAQTKFAAHVLESYAEKWQEEGLTGSDIMKAAVTNYHLTQETANEKIKSGKWDDYTKSVIERSETISLNKELGLSAKDMYNEDMELYEEKDIEVLLS